MENIKHYSDYFVVPKGYRANMTREELESAPDRWLQFYPHPKYIGFLKTLLQSLNGGVKPVWLTGNYGTGKSFAALVTQKLFMGDETKVKEWFKLYRGKIDDCDAVEKNLFQRRTENTFVVYDYNAQGVGPNEEFLVRLERSIVASLKESGLIVPPKANLAEVIERIKDEDLNFLKTRDVIQGELAYLSSRYTTIAQIVTELSKPVSGAETTSGLLGDIQRVLYERSIFLGLTAKRFKEWIGQVLEKNKISRIVYIFDEFSTFIEKNKDSLKTFEEVAEGEGKFFLMPVTHLSINAYWAEGSDNARKANNRFFFRELEMLPDVAFQLAAAAMEPIEETKDEWHRERSELLWSAISDFAGTYFSEKDVSRKSLFDILPLHPMAAFLLKFLSTSVGSNQRSIFEYLKGSADGYEFQDFIRVGGPAISGKQFLTVDYLWKYFIERDDLGLSKEVRLIRSEFERIKNREFKNRDEDDIELRVLKTVLLFCLLNRLNPDGHERLRPTVQNIELSFKGDGSVVDVRSIVKGLADKHCFSIVNDNIETFNTSIGGVELDNEIAKIENEFHKLLHEDAEDAIAEHTKNQRGAFSGGRFDIRVSDVDHVGATYFPDASRKKYASDVNATDSATLLWFVVAKNNAEQLRISEKVTNFLEQFKEHRVICISLPKVTFCDSNAENWREYITLFAKYNLEIDNSSKQQGKRTLDKIKEAWFSELKKSDQELKVFYSSQFGGGVQPPIVWAQFKNTLTDYIRKALPQCPDLLTTQLKLFDSQGLKGWAMAGINLDGPSGPTKQFISAIKSQGLTSDEAWFAQNPTHLLSQIFDLFYRKISNTIAKSSTLSIRKVYIELQRAPYGLKYNAMSAFVLGFVLKGLLSKNYQWTNGALTRPLEDQDLAEIIEAVVKNDGAGEIRGEKLICKLSKEEKVFVECAPKMFGDMVSVGYDSTIENALKQIVLKIETVSKRIPLWVLPPYINSLSDPQSEVIAEVINNVCIALANSSKTQDERIVAVKKVGEIISETDGIVECVADYVKIEHFVVAFAQYVDKSVPKLKKLAESLGDFSSAYLDSVKGKASETAGWLWKPADISVDIESTIQEYEAIRELKSIIGLSDFRSFAELIGILRTSMVTNNKLPKAIIVSEYPSMVALISQVTNGGGLVGLPENIKANSAVLKQLFFDASSSDALRIISKLIPSGSQLPQTDLFAMYKALNTDLSTPEVAFISDFQIKLEEYSKNSIARKIKAEWERITGGSETPDEWALTTSIPARFALGNCHNYMEVLNSVERPDGFSPAKLLENLEILKNLLIAKVVDAQKQFIAETIPVKYLKFNISFASLIEFLREKLGTQPNRWAKRPDIDEFIREQYKVAFAPQIADQIRNTKADELKEKLCKLAKENPELGLLFWE